MACVHATLTSLLHLMIVPFPCTERLTEYLKVLRHPPICAVVMLVFRVILVRFSSSHLMAFWPAITSELVRIVLTEKLMTTHTYLYLICIFFVFSFSYCYWETWRVTFVLRYRRGYQSPLTSSTCTWPCASC